jgi:hypothetical protein
MPISVHAEFDPSTLVVAANRSKDSNTTRYPGRATFGAGYETKYIFSQHNSSLFGLGIHDHLSFPSCNAFDEDRHHRTHRWSWCNRNLSNRYKYDESPRLTLDSNQFNYTRMSDRHYSHHKSTLDSFRGSCRGGLNK